MKDFCSQEAAVEAATMAASIIFLRSFGLHTGLRRQQQWQPRQLQRHHQVI
jgi:hypothetical protein